MKTAPTAQKAFDVDFRRRSDPAGKPLTDPVLILDNGRRVWFSVQENEGSEYGIRACISEKRGAR
jgi:hypothetical protein